MKKSVLFATLVALFLVFFSVLPLISASTNSTVANNGYSCLENKTSGQCADLTIGQQVFTSLATGTCTDYVENSSDNGCWPSGSCDIITTSQAMLALVNRGVSVNSSESWLISKNLTVSDIAWYLQIDSNKPTTCDLSVPSSSTSSTIYIGSDKKISSNNLGTCFTVSPNGYWLQVNPSCFNENFQVSCNESFTTTKLYQRTPADQYPAIYVSGTSQTASSNAQITDSINNSHCFGTGGVCDYESTLWASLILNRLGYSVSPYLPYLTLEASDSQNTQYLPYAFLYAITSSPDYLTSLLDSQNTVNGQKYWDYSQDPYFGTSLALLAIKSSDSTDANNAITWLSSVQGSNGCWNNGNILNTAFVLYSAFGPRNLASSSPPPSQQCSDVGYCLSASVCESQAGGVPLGNSYSTTCPGIQICCSKNYQVPTCAAQNGVLCNSGQVCNVSSISSSDSTSEQICCPSSGSCITPSNPTATSCDSLNGVCRNSCFSDEISPALGTCSLSSQVCCVKSVTSGQGTSRNIVWIILLSILIVLAVLGIIFRKKLPGLWHKIKGLFGKGKGRGNGTTGPFGPGYGPRRPPFPPRGPPPPPMIRRPMPRQRPRPSPEVNAVLKKLKEMGK